MTNYLISFPSGAMDVADEELEEVGRDAHQVLRQAKEAGAWVFGGGIDETVPAVRVASDGQIIEGPYPVNQQLSGGFAILELATRAEAEAWAARFAAACRCPQELREFMYDSES